MNTFSAHHTPAIIRPYQDVFGCSDSSQAFFTAAKKGKGGISVINNPSHGAEPDVGIFFGMFYFLHGCIFLMRTHTRSKIRLGLRILFRKVQLQML